MTERRPRTQGPAAFGEGNPGNPEHLSTNPSERESGKEDCMEIPRSKPRTAATEQGKPGWVSPEYAVSRPAVLDSDRVRRNRCVAVDAVAPEAEHYRMLRTSILHRTAGNGGTTMMVTSTLPGEGKTLTAINLAFSFARSFSQTVLLVDADLKQQRIRETLGLKNGKGLGDCLLDGCPLSDAIVWPGREKLTVLSGGRTVADSSELLGSPAMKALVEEMKGRYPERYVIFDTAPVLVGADAAAFAPMVDWILFVVQAGRTSLQDVRRAIGILPQEKVLGLVLNQDPRAAVPDYYRYKYKYE